MTLAVHLLPKPAPRPTPSGLLAGGLLGLWGLYVLVFMTTEDSTFAHAAAAAAANVLPLGALALAARAAVARVAAQKALVQVSSHAALAAAFSLAWYGAIVLLLTLWSWLGGHGSHLRGFSGPALAWQVFQGLVVYSAIAAACYALRSNPPPTEVVEIRTRAASPLERYLIREGEDYRPVDVADIVSIAGAQDYSEVSTPSGRHLVRMSLGEFEARLDPRRFIRVHRSAIIQLAFLERAEPAGGGRMLAHMTNGERVPISRTGVKALRPLIV